MTTLFLGDSQSLEIPLTWNGLAFTPGDDWSLIWTLKAAASDLDSAAKIQKATGAGITVDETTATIELVPQDSTSLAAARYVSDVQAQHVTTGEVRTVAYEKVEFVRDVTRSTQTSIPIRTTAAPHPSDIISAIEAADSMSPVSGDAEVPVLISGGLLKVTLTAIKSWVLSGLEIAWGSVTGKPSAFTPSAHTHPANEITGLGNAALATTSTGGNGAADSGKVAAFGTVGQIRATSNLRIDSATGGRSVIISPPISGSENTSHPYTAPLSDGSRTKLASTSNDDGIPDNLVTSSTKTTPIDADSVLMTDSAAAGTPAKRVTFANLWTWIKSKIESVALTLTGVTITNYTEATVAIGNSGASQTIALTNGTRQTMTMTANCTVTMPTATNGKSFVMRIITGAGGYVPTFTGVVWPDNTAPTFNSTAGRYYNVVFEADGANWTGAVGPTYHS